MRGLSIKNCVIPKHFIFLFNPLNESLKSALQFHLDCFVLILLWWHTELKLGKLCQCPNIYGPDCICHEHT